MRKSTRKILRHRQNTRHDADPEAWREFFFRTINKDYQRPARLPRRMREMLRWVGLHGAYSQWINRPNRGIVRPTRGGMFHVIWRAIVFGLIDLLTSKRVQADPALRTRHEHILWQAMLFEWARVFHEAWCEYGSHWYVSDDPRRRDCWEHERAGAKARFILKHPEAARRAKLRELEQRKIRRRMRRTQ